MRSRRIRCRAVGQERDAQAILPRFAFDAEKMRRRQTNEQRTFAVSSEPIGCFDPCVENAFQAGLPDVAGRIAYPSAANEGLQGIAGLVLTLFICILGI